MPSFEIPAHMQALELTDYDPALAALRLVERPVPRPGPGQVLVRLAYAPINTSDRMFMRGTYVLRKRLPVVPGTVGSGRVVAAGPGGLPRLLLGRAVSCAAPFDGNGPWAEYMVASAQTCVPLLRGVDLEQGANMLSNPLTALGLVETLHQARHRCFIQNAAASDIARMVQVLAARRGMQVINVVRRPQSVARLQALGTAHVLDASDPSFDKELRRLCDRLHPTALLDSVSGADTRRLGALLAPRGEIIVWGKLSGEAPQLPENELYNLQLRVRAFSVMEWSRSMPLLQPLRLIYALEGFVAAYGDADPVRKVSLAGVPGQVAAQAQSPAAGRTFIQCGGA